MFPSVRMVHTNRVQFPCCRLDGARIKETENATIKEPFPPLYPGSPPNPQCL